MLFSTSLTIWYRLRGFHCPLSQLSDCFHKHFPSRVQLHVCVCLPQTVTFGVTRTTQLLKIHPVCAATSTKHLDESRSSQINWKMLHRAQNNCSHFTQPQLPSVLQQGRKCDTEREDLCAEPEIFSTEAENVEIRAGKSATS